MVGPFSKEEEQTLRNAVDDYIGNLHGIDRDEALRTLFRKRGRCLSQGVTLGCTVLPERHPKSVYNFIRRRIVPHKTGRWQCDELYVLLNHYFHNEDDYTKAYENKRKWRSVSQQTGRLPEQIHDKWKEIGPHVEVYRPIFEDASLSESEKVERVSQLSIHKGDASNSQCTDGESDDRPRHDLISSSQKGRLMDDMMRKELHDYIRSLVNNGVIQPPIVHNIPWSIVREQFPELSQSHLRLTWTLCILPSVLERQIYGLNSLVVGRAAVYKVYKDRLFEERLSHIDFSKLFPQLPQLYVIVCLRKLLKKCVDSLRSGTLQNVDVYYKKQLVNDESTYLALIGATATLPSASDAVSEGDSSHDECSATNDEECNTQELSSKMTVDESPVIYTPAGCITVTLRRQLRLAFYESQAKQHHERDMEILSRISETSLPRMMNDYNTIN
ncbi:uncharacterized protein BXIN_0198 [Babesia sp. Xinjiang]|uniref:uncharacterized protein n=1 Tax=Babesia sp. Xinjiang TaxID=462227 RepID=UPI000A24A628|nr:uncharacterized protein BXIN_0198 [Babesia sp. Xinjiang]ORM39842.1 hypothetical protein BXIN_0198 [Babesia sp. Xinjiang]